ncbi:MAG: outer membrane beta-barrel protein [Pseudomonadota bacterium]
MTKHTRRFSGILLAVAALTMGVAAQAQTSSTGASGSSTMSSSGGFFGGSQWYRPAGGSYIGFNAGRSDFGGSCGATQIVQLNCDNTGDAYSLYTGGMWNKNFGVELGINDFGRIDRAGGTTKAYGFNISLVGSIPLTQSFSVFGKLGTIYGRTTTSANALTGLASGSDNGWGSTYGLGVNFDITPQLAAVVQVDQSNLRFVNGKDHINTTSVGLKYRF